MTERDPGRDVEPFAVRPARRQRRRHAPDQSCDISGLRVQLSEPCNSTHVLRIRFLLPRTLVPHYLADEMADASQTSPDSRVVLNPTGIWL
jgi:hypothetical protein